eukprot:TRINITY_DN12552_c0_g1_i2.p1 TRINITY_DN12552_c0_g1~~TRINITY_DN12552_c0_g1_i2.p1  ORF type:complete len:237 (-),score=34.39 TRINITY_DN12552_c0_g1_i2:138-848(-)
MQSVPERIIFCVDLADEPPEPGKWSANFQLVKQSVLTFMHIKLTASPQHSFALCTLAETALWVQDFTSDPNVMGNTLGNLFPHHTQGNLTHCDLGSLFDTIAQNARLTDPSPPTCITRALLIYARSDVVPASITHCPSWNTLREHPGFVFDAIFLHARANQSPKCQDVYNFLTSMQQGPSADGRPRNQFYLEVVRSNERRFFEKFALLLAHSGQREDQFEFKTNLEPLPEASDPVA